MRNTAERNLNEKKGGALVRMARPGEGGAVSGSGDAGAAASSASGVEDAVPPSASEQRATLHDGFVEDDDERLRAALELSTTWNGCEGAAQTVRKWSAHGPDANISFDGCDSVDTNILPAEFFAYGRDRVAQIVVWRIPRLVVLPDAVSRFTSMTYLCISGCGITVLPAILGECVALTYIDVSSCPVHTIPSEVLALPVLTRLFARECQLDAPALIVVAGGVRRSTSIAGIFMPDNPGSCTTEVLSAFAHALRSNGSLTTLQLFSVGLVRYNQLEFATAIQVALERNKRREAPPDPYTLLVKAARV